MKEKLRAVILFAVVGILAITAAACSQSDSAASPSAEATPPGGGEATMIVVTPRPTPVATPTPAETSSAASGEGDDDNESASPTSSSTSTSSGSSGGSSDVLKRESEGEAVTEAQQRLEALGYLSKVTGYFGTDTEKAVKEFQERNGLDPDGKIGPATLEVLMSEDAKKAN